MISSSGAAKKRRRGMATHWLASGLRQGSRQPSVTENAFRCILAATSFRNSSESPESMRDKICVTSFMGAAVKIA